MASPPGSGADEDHARPLVRRERNQLSARRVALVLGERRRRADDRTSRAVEVEEPGVEGTLEALRARLRVAARAVSRGGGRGSARALARLPTRRADDDDRRTGLVEEQSVARPPESRQDIPASSGVSRRTRRSASSRAAIGVAADAGDARSCSLGEVGGHRSPCAATRRRSIPRHSSAESRSSRPLASPVPSSPKPSIGASARRQAAPLPFLRSCGHLVAARAAHPARTRRSCPPCAAAAVAPLYMIFFTGVIGEDRAERRVQQREWKACCAALVAAGCTLLGERGVEPRLRVRRRRRTRPRPLKVTAAAREVLPGHPACIGHRS